MSRMRTGAAVLSVASLFIGGAVASANVPDEDLASPSKAAQVEGVKFVVNGFVIQDDLMMAKVAGHQARDAALTNGS